MSKLTPTLVILALFFIASVIASEDVNNLWGAFKTAHKKRYLDSEESHRFAIFKQNVAKIAKLNAEYKGAKFAINQFSDLTSEEFKQKFTSEPIQDQAFSKEVHAAPINEITSLSTTSTYSMDWRARGAVTPVKDQGACGSCWAFTTVAAIESLNIIANKTKLGFTDFSEQQMLDCGNRFGRPGLNGCRGGQLIAAFIFANDSGLANETAYPYRGIQSTCVNVRSQKVISSYYVVPPKIPYALKSYLELNPIAVDLQGDQDVFRYYKSGVISAGCGATINHSGLVVGYQEVNGQEAWIVKNSWGKSWGVDGYVYISTNSTYNNGAGPCGILSSPTCPTF